MKIYNCVNDFFEPVGNVGAVFLFFGVGLAVGGLMYVSDGFQKFVVFGIDTLHCRNAPALAVGVIFESKCFVLLFQFFHAVHVLKINVFHCFASVL